MAHLAVPALVTLTAPRAAIGREEAREAAQRELSKPIYHRDDPSLFMQALMKLLEWIQRVLEGAADVAPGGWAGLAAILLLLVLFAVAIRLRVGQVARSRARGEPLLTGRPLTAGEHREGAERYAAAQQWAEAVRERLRAVARELEQRAVLDPRPGRTADELAAEAADVLPAHAGELRAVTRLFDDVWYGGRAASAADYDRTRRLDEQLRAARPRLAGDAR